MKLRSKIILAIGLILTLAVQIFAIVEANTVAGDNLLKTSVSFGSFCVDTYRWMALVAIILLVFWTIWTVVFGRKIISKTIKSIKENNEKKAAFQLAAMKEYTNAYSQAQPNINAADLTEIFTTTKVYCTNCGCELDSDTAFCPNCGEKV